MFKISCLLGVLLLATSISAWSKDMEDAALYEGDMILTPDQREEVKNGQFKFGSISNRNKLWLKNGQAIVPYKIEYSLATERDAVREINAAIAEYHKYTCIKFVKHSNEAAYITFWKGSSCSSPVGKRCRDTRCEVATNRISLSKGCWWRATIMHEVAHSLGLHHEQSRPDRDQYVKILRNNIHASTYFNFEKEKKTDVDSLDTPYDYLSMMHYNWNAFGKDQAMTIKTADPKYQYLIGQDEGFSEIDVIQINKMYQCKGTYQKVKPFVFPPKGCYDLGGACGKSRHEGLCTQPQWRNYMHSKCRLSCGLCGDGPRPTDGGKPVTFPPAVTDKPTDKPVVTKPPIGDCRDRVVDCRFHGTHRCNGSSAVWKKFMAKSCRKYCGLC